MKSLYIAVLCLVCSVGLISCASQHGPAKQVRASSEGHSYLSQNYSSRIPQNIATKEKVIVIDPNVHVWGAYSNGSLVRAGLVTAGNHYCADIKRGCKTPSGHFRISSLGGPGCKSTRYPLGKGGAPMPYCMFFSGNYSLHGSPEVIEGNVSHGCVRLRVDDAAWVRYGFANVGTKVIVKSY